MKIKARSGIDMTKGSLFVNILRFIFPLILTNLLQQLYHAADVVVVGLSSDPNAIGAVSSTGTYLGLVRNLFIGFSVGASVVTARAIGAGKEEDTSRAVHTSVCMSVLFGVLGGALGMLLLRPVFLWMGYTGSLLTLGLRYSYIYLACLPFLSLTNVLSAVLHAKGDTKTSLWVLSGTGVLNVLLNLLFVVGIGMSVEGVAIATAVANLASAVLLWTALAKSEGGTRLSFRLLRMSKKHFCDVARIGFPSGIQSAFFSLSNLLITSSILEVNALLTPAGSLYDPVVKGNAAASGIENFLFAAMNAVNSTASTLIGQNVGKGDHRRVWRAFFTLCGTACLIALIMSGACILLRDPLLALYGVRAGGDALGKIAYDTAITRVIYKWPTFVTYAFLTAASGTLRGLGKSSLSAAISFVGTCVFRIVWISTVFRALVNLGSIYISYPISWVVTGVVIFILVLRFLRKSIKNAETETAV